MPLEFLLSLGLPYADGLQFMMAATNPAPRLLFLLEICPTLWGWGKGWGLGAVWVFGAWGQRATVRVLLFFPHTLLPPPGDAQACCRGQWDKKPRAERFPSEPRGPVQFLAQWQGSTRELVRNADS